ncbi:MAG: ATP-dependent zinc metalloprotease FtsH [Thermodesulfobacteriota bacterium]
MVRDKGPKPAPPNWIQDFLPGGGAGKKKIPPKTHFSLWYFLVAISLLIMFQNFYLSGQTQTIPYSQFKSLVAQGRVDQVIIDQEVITGHLKPDSTSGRGSRFRVFRVEDNGLVEALEKAGVIYSGSYENKFLSGLISWVAPMLIFMLIWLYVVRKMGPGGGVMSFGKSRARIYAEDEVKVTFEDVAGIDEAKAELEEVVEFLRNPDKYRQLGGRIPKGVLLVGPPGTGKTLLARAVAGEAKVPFFSMSGSEFVEMFVGVGAARVRDMFRQAQQHAPCIVFIDELDALGKARGLSPMGGHDEREQTLNQLLVEMDGFDPAKGVIIMAATNRPEILDPALLRPGRFDRQVLIDRPDIKGREAILRVHVQRVKLARGVNLHEVAASTPGFVGADLANLVNEAALRAARKGKKAVDMQDFDEAIDRIVGGLEKKNRVMNPREKQIVAYHEAGHALVAESVPNGDPVRKISIIPRGIAALGYTQQLPTEDRYLMTKSELEDRIAVLLGGRVAEEMVFEDVSTGARNDLQRATDLARAMVTEYGMSQRLGFVTFQKERRSIFLEGPAIPRDYSEERARIIDEEIGRILAEAHQRVRGLLEERRDLLEKVACALLEREVMEGAELRELIQEAGFPVRELPQPEKKKDRARKQEVASKEA